VFSVGGFGGSSGAQDGLHKSWPSVALTAPSKVAIGLFEMPVRMSRRKRGSFALNNDSASAAAKKAPRARLFETLAIPGWRLKDCERA